MNLSSRCSTRENTNNQISTGPIVTATDNLKPESVIISYNHESFSRSNASTLSSIDNDKQNPCSNSGLSASTKKKNFSARRKASVINKKRSVVLKPLVNPKKLTKIRPKTCETQKEQILFSESTQRIENFENQSDAVTTNRETSPNCQQDFTYSSDVPKTSRTSKITSNYKTFTEEITLAHEEISSLKEKEIFNKLNKTSGFSALQNKASKIPRIKPNSFLSAAEESHIHSNKHVSMENKFKRSTSAKVSTAHSEEESHAESGDSAKRKVLNVADCQRLHPVEILQTVHENPTNLWYFEKSSEMDADEELEGNLSPSPISESRIIAGAGDDPRSATLLKSLALKCKCPSCNDNRHRCNEHKHTNHTDRHTESDSWSSPEVKSARKWKVTKPHKFVDISTEDSNLLSDYSGINYNIKGTGKNNGISNVTSRVKKSSVTNDATRLNIHRTASFSFFNVFFDIVFWPFVFLRAKR